MKKQYNEPQLYVENVVVESGIAASYGNPGAPGQEGIYDIFEDEL